MNMVRTAYDMIKNEINKSLWDGSRNVFGG